MLVLWFHNLFSKCKYNICTVQVEIPLLKFSTKRITMHFAIHFHGLPFNGKWEKNTLASSKKWQEYPQYYPHISICLGGGIAPWRAFPFMPVLPLSHSFFDSQPGVQISLVSWKERIYNQFTTLKCPYIFSTFTWIRLLKVW